MSFPSHRRTNTMCAVVETYMTRQSVSCFRVWSYSLKGVQACFIWCSLFYLVQACFIWCSLFYLVQACFIWCSLFYLVQACFIWCSLFYLVGRFICMVAWFICSSVSSGRNTSKPARTMRADRLKMTQYSRHILLYKLLAPASITS